MVAKSSPHKNPAGHAYPFTAWLLQQAAPGQHHRQTVNMYLYAGRPGTSPGDADIGVDTQEGEGTTMTVNRPVVSA